LIIFRSLNFQQAYSNILAAEKYKPTELFIEKAKLLWKKSDQGQAIATLKKGINMLFPNMDIINTLPCDEKIEERKTCASVCTIFYSFVILFIMSIVIMGLGNLFLNLPPRGFTIVNISELVKCILLTVLIVNLNCFFIYIQFINHGMIHLGTNKFYLGMFMKKEV